MKSVLLSTFSFTLLGLGASQSLQLVQNPSVARCVDIKFTVEATADNRALFDPPSDLYSDIPAIIAFLYQENGNKLVTGTYDINAQYCTPAKKHPKANAPLLLMVHGNTYDHTYYGGLNAVPVKQGTAAVPYSWVDYATKQGYYTLSIDRLGSGKSSHPDPVMEVQAPLQVAAIASLIKTHIKTKAFDKLIFVGHSYGSILGTQLAKIEPTLVDTYVMTGIAHEDAGDNPLPKQLAAVHMQASVYDPVRFPPSVYTPGYLVPTQKPQREDTFYSTPKVDFDSTIYDLDFDTKDIITLGEAATQTKYVADGYTGGVFVTTGKIDSVFCGNGTHVEADCERRGTPNQLQDFVAKYFPAATKTGTYVQQSAGHCALLHYSWLDAIKAIHKWLDGPRLPSPN